MTLQAEPLVFNPFDPNFRINPYPVYKRLREEDPVHQSPFGMVVLTRYRDCEAVLRDRRWSADVSNSTVRGLEPDPELLGDSKPFLFLDPPDHTRLRRLVNKAFTPRTVETLRPRVQELVDGLLDAVEEKGSLEVIEDIAYPLPVIVISEMLGVPTEDHPTFRGWSAELAAALDPSLGLPPEVIERRRQAIRSFDDYFRALIERRRSQPGDDLLTALIQAEEEGDKLNEGELLATCRLILIAGHETTVNLIANGMLALLRHPDQLRKLRDDPSLAVSATEEVLRWDPPVQLTGRIAHEDIAIDGVTIEKGHGVICLLAAANRDPEQYADPDRFDISRGDDSHLSFGHGVHFCLGAPLARIEGQIALSTMALRFPKLELAVEQPEYRPNIVLRGLKSLPVRT